MLRGIQRHERLQNACGRYISTVKDIRTCKKVSVALTKEMTELTLGAPDKTPVYVFKELVLNRVRKQSRRADLVFYVPGVSIIYVEYKTIEKGPGYNHDIQLEETRNNLIRNLLHKLSCLDESRKTTAPIPIASLLLTRRFDVKQCDSIVRHSVVASDGVCDTVSPNDMLSILRSMGRLLNNNNIQNSTCLSVLI